MKKLAVNFIALILLSGSIYAQSDAKAKAILAEVSKKFRSYNIVKTEFLYSLNNPQANIKETESGSLYVKSKANKYKVILASQELISDGKTQWTYLKNDKEVQINDIDVSQNALNPAQIFTIYEKGFKYLFTGESKFNNIVYQNIELAPLTTKSYSKIKLVVDKVKKQLATITIYEKNGNVHMYMVKTFAPNVKISESIFAFDASKYPGVEVVDLR